MTQVPLSRLDIDVNRLFSLNAESDNTTSLNYGIYNGMASFTVFKKSERGPVLKLPMDIKRNALFKNLIHTAISAEKGTKNELIISRWDPETSKRNTEMTVYVGKDDKGNIYIGFSKEGMQPIKFIFRGFSGWEVRHISAAQQSELVASEFCKLLDSQSAVASVITSYPREFNKQQKSGGGYNKSNSRSSGYDDEIAF